jgi:hypothetical protein
MKSFEFYHIQKYLCVAERGKLLCTGVEGLTSGFAKHFVHVSWVEFIPRSTSPVRHVGFCQCCWLLCSGVNHCISYSVSLVCCHECFTKCWFQNFLSFAYGVTRMLLSSAIGHLGPVCAFVALACCCVMFNVTRTFEKQMTE